MKKLIYISLSLLFLFSTGVISETKENKTYISNTNEIEELIKKDLEDLKKRPDRIYVTPRDADIYFSCIGNMEYSYYENGKFITKKNNLLNQNKDYLTFIFNPKTRYFEGNDFTSGHCRFWSMQIDCDKKNNKELFDITINRINGNIIYKKYSLGVGKASKENPIQNFSGFCKKVDIIF